MSIQDSDMVSYADHDVHHIAHRVINNESTGGDDYVVEAVEEFEITERGLDPDELAELRAMRVQVGAFCQALQPQDSRGEFSFTIDAGFNIGVSDALHTASLNTTQFDPDGDGTDEAASSVRETDEVGQVYTYADNYNVGFDDDANGNGAGGNSNATAEMLNMQDLFGSGPFVDSADDFVSVVRVLPENVIETFGVQINYSLYYDVNEQEGGRTRFGR